MRLAESRVPPDDLKECCGTAASEDLDPQPGLAFGP